MKCPECLKNYGIYVRLKSKQAVCRNCGYIGNIKDFKENKEKE